MKELMGQILILAFTFLMYKYGTEKGMLQLILLINLLNDFFPNNKA